MDELQEFQGLLQELLQAIQISMESGESLPDEVQGEIARTLEILYNRIEQLMGQESGEIPNIPQTQPELEPGPFPSSNVNSFKYNPKTQDLFVKFHGKESAGSGPLYKYSQIPQYIYDVFSRGAIGPKTSGQNRYHRWIKNVTPSLGGTLNALIKAGNFSYQRLT